MLFTSIQETSNDRSNLNYPRICLTVPLMQNYKFCQTRTNKTGGNLSQVFIEDSIGSRRVESFFHRSVEVSLVVSQFSSSTVQQEVISNGTSRMVRISSKSWKISSRWKGWSPDLGYSISSSILVVVIVVISVISFK